MFKWIKTSLLCILLLGVCVSCGPKQKGFEWKKNQLVLVVESRTTVQKLRDQQFVVRDLIDNCEAFDCSVLEDEKAVLRDYVFDEVSPIVQGIQQSIVTSITRRCNKNEDYTGCADYAIQMAKLRKLLNNYMEK